VRNLLIAVSAALLLGGCGSGPSSVDTDVPVSLSAKPTTPSLASSGSTDVFGLLIDLDPSAWTVVEATSATFVLEYRMEECLPGRCAQLLFSRPAQEGASSFDGEYYRLNVREGNFVLETECATNQSAFEQAKEHEAPFEVAGKPTRYYINEPCSTFTQGQVWRRQTWHLPKEELLIQYLVHPDLTETSFVQHLSVATWEG
jgi:hypothetical protein